jgi:hypothetical protein
MKGYLQQSVSSYREQASDSKPMLKVDTPFLPDDARTDIEFVPGLHSLVAQSVLPKLLYAARLARPDLVLPINLLSRQLNKWSVNHDKALRRLVCYVECTHATLMRGFIGSGPISLQLYCDADFAGCLETACSTSGLWLTMSGPGWDFPLEWGSKRQTCVAHSTPEAELV